MSARSVFRSRTVVRGAAVWAAVVVWAAPAMAQSLWTVRSGSLVSDVKARAAGDLVTILIDETTTAEKSAGTGDDRLDQDGDGAGLDRSRLESGSEGDVARRQQQLTRHAG